MKAQNIKLSAQQRAGNKANNTARSAVLRGVKNSDFKPNNASGLGGMNLAPKVSKPITRGRGK